MRLEMCGINHQAVQLACLAGKGLENTVEDPQLAPAKEAIVERFVRTIFLRRVFPLKSMFNT